MENKIKILFAEDDEFDVLLVVDELKRHNIEPVYERVETEEDFRNKIEDERWDIIISDYSMPQFTGFEALKILQQSKLDIPFLLVSGTIGEEVAVNAMKMGASDYLMKGNINRLVPAIEREIREAKSRKDKRATEKSILQYNLIMEAIATSAHELLTDGNYKASIQKFINRLGEAGITDGIYIHQDENWKNSNGKDISLELTYEWKDNGISTLFDNSEFRELKVKKDVLREWSNLNSEEPVTDLMNNFSPDMKDIFKSLGIQSTLIFPIVVKHKWWGVISFCEFRFKRQWNKLDIDAIQIVSNLLSGYIERENTQLELARSEQSFRTIFENAQVGIYRTTPEGDIIIANPALINMLRYDNFEDLAKRNLEKETDTIYNRQEFKALIQEKGEIRNYESKWKRRDGQLVYVNEFVRAVYDKNGNIIFYDGIVEDITDRKRKEIELQEAKEDAEKSDKLKTEFLAQMSHEIRTPVNVITNFSNLIEEFIDIEKYPDADEYFSIIEGASQRLIRTIDQILNMSELQIGTYNPEFKKVDLYEEVLKPLSKEFIRLAQTKGLSLYLHLLCDEPPVVKIDKYSTGQIFSNLIDNSIKYTEKGGVEVIIESRPDNYQVIIKDTGIGMSDDFLKELFNPFRQEQQGYTRKYEGNGLGLALVKQYCNVNGIRVDVESQKGKGSTFTVTFPKIG